MSQVENIKQWHLQNIQFKCFRLVLIVSYNIEFFYLLRFSFSYFSREFYKYHKNELQLMQNRVAV